MDIEDPWRKLDPLYKEEKPGTPDYDAPLNAAKTFSLEGRAGSIIIRHKNIENKDDGLLHFIKLISALLKADKTLQVPVLVYGIGETHWRNPAFGFDSKGIEFKTSEEYAPHSYIIVSGQNAEGALLNLIRFFLSVPTVHKPILQHYGVLIVRR